MNPQIEQGLVRRLHTGDDLVRYSGNQPHVQRGLLEAIDPVRQRAARVAGLDREAAYKQPQGDGEFVRWPAAPSTLDILLRYPPALRNELLQANVSRHRDAALRLRLAMVEGLTEAAPGGLSGDPFVMVSRFLSCWQARRALVLTPDCPLVVVVDQDIFRDTVAKEFLGLRPDQYVEILVHDEDKDFEMPAWLTLPGSTPEQTEAVREQVGVGVGFGPNQSRTTARPSRPAPARTNHTPHTDRTDHTDHTPIPRPAAGRTEPDGADEEAGDPPPTGRHRRPTWFESALAVALVGAIATIAAAVVPPLLDGGDDAKSPTPSLSPKADTRSTPSDAPSTTSGIPAQVRWTNDGGSTFLRSYVSPKPGNATPTGSAYPAGETLTLNCRFTEGRSIKVGATYSGPDPDSTVWYQMTDGAWVPAVYVDPGSTSVPLC
ncbi:hypothetical protein SAMN04487983_103287 [Streptomyces sp. yr375]|uniref:hypothetical protein n=1 Tax=Streptomyces sp. yr375 TaxID=1761906 RepID=UPI0008BE28E7|nr:hypothetical protein [Streptomyces sp. yr375]SES14054.1 hypothetical protein SAMN04487983_103287 [Streptomyces sp. yr375]